MKRAIASVLFLAAVSVTVACGATRRNYVRVDDVALGKVVVYRNGVAFYERRAIVKGGKLTVVVPRDRIDDFLKSLTVADARTGDPLPVIFPREQADYGAQYIEMTLEVPGKDAEVVLTYVTESPAWKPSYRLVVDEQAKKVMLQAWAIVDNTSGEDWKDVELGVGSSSAMAFKYDLWTVRTVARETLQTENSFAVAPPIAQSTYSQVAGSAENVVANFDDAEIRRPPGHPEYVEEAARAAAPEPSPTSDKQVSYGGGYDDDSDYEVTVSGGSGKTKSTRSRKIKAKPAKKRTAKADEPRDGSRIVVGGTTHQVRDTRAPEGDAKVKALADSLRTNGQTIVIEGYGDPNEADGAQRALDRANLVRNQLIDNGVPPAQVRVVNKGVVAGAAPGVRVVSEGADGRTASQTYAEIDAPPVGESHFVSQGTMTVPRGSSILASMLMEETEGEIAYLYDAESERGNDKYAFRAVRLDNPTDFTLEPGPVEVYGKGKMIGEGLTEAIPPRASVVIPFALDRQVVVERDDGTENRVSRLMTLQRGILTAEVQHIRKTRLIVTSRLRTASKVYVRHTVAKGWALLDAPEVFEKIADAHLFEIPLEAGQTRVVEISEATPMVRTLDLQADLSLEMMKVYLDTAELSAELRADIKKLLAIHKEMVDGKEKIDSLRRQLAEYRLRMDELHAQIVTLKAVKSGGDLLKHLEGKMKDISSRVQKTTIAVVDTDEKIMLARVRFQDALSELTLPDATAPSGGGGGAVVGKNAP
jgi:outer membrane protein OmpA-like peptidoglycan-associated protein